MEKISFETRCDPFLADTTQAQKVQIQCVFQTYSMLQWISMTIVPFHHVKWAPSSSICINPVAVRCIAWMLTWFDWYVSNFLPMHCARVCWLCRKVLSDAFSLKRQNKHAYSIRHIHITSSTVAEHMHVGRIRTVSTFLKDPGSLWRWRCHFQKHYWQPLVRTAPHVRLGVVQSLEFIDKNV